METERIELTSLEDLDRVWTLSAQKPCLLFKHSTRCPISTRALAAFEQARSRPEAAAVAWVYLDLIAHRDVSNEIAMRSGVTHQSPQAILLREGKPVWRASHIGITVDSLLLAIGPAKT
jgi:bacillithiol system protein YtxJ